MITRDFGDGGWCAAGAGNPPPLHVRDTESVMANWYPLPRPFLRAQPPGPVLVTIPQLPGNAVGEDPTDPGRQLAPRTACSGMVARLNIHAGERNVAARGVRR